MKKHIGPRITLALTLAAALLASIAGFAQDNSGANSNAPVRRSKRIDLKKDFATLGDNGDLEERAKNLSANSRVEVVQNRIVDLNNRFELGANFGLAGNGDSYINTQNLGVQADYHFSPRWSLGARYYHSYNQLTAEANHAYQTAAQTQALNGGAGGTMIPQYDVPLNTELAVINFYPVYGKMNLFDAGVAHFDVYVLAGAGQVSLNSGNSTAYTGGLGLGVWLSQHFAVRFEVRYEGYHDLVTTDNRQENTIQGQAGIGILL